MEGYYSSKSLHPFVSKDVKDTVFIIGNDLKTCTIQKKKNMLKKKVLILHGFPYHYEMIPSVLYYFRDYDIDLFSSPFSYDFVQWIYHFYKKLNVTFRVIKTLVPKQYDLCIFPTDDDKIMSFHYHKLFFGTPIYIINHQKGVNRTIVPEDFKYCLDIQGIQNKNVPFHFCGCFYMNLEKKLSTIAKLTINVAVIGNGAITPDSNFLSTLRNRFSNFNVIQFFIINRVLEPAFVKEVNGIYNVHLHSNCDSETMFHLLEKSHYIYYFPSKVDLTKSSGCFGLSYSFLCRMICPPEYASALETSLALTIEDDESMELKPVDKFHLIELERERRRFINATSDHLKKLLMHVLQE